MHDAGLTWCPEIESSSPCRFMEGDNFRETPLCPGCFAAHLGPMRRKNWSGSQATAPTGLIRLGTWREIRAKDYEDFCRGQGVNLNGEAWSRTDFPTRAHFVVTRGLEEWALYERMAANSRCINIQCSVDVIVHGDQVLQVPDDARLKQFLGVPKALFRFKTLAAPATQAGKTFDRNVEHFRTLQERLGIPWNRVMETPLRIAMNRSYQTTTPLEADGLDPAAFMRCNTECHECGSTKDGQAENRFLACAATERMLANLAVVGNVRPKRIEAAPRVRIPWTQLLVRAWISLGGEAPLREIYATVQGIEQGVLRNPHWKAKVRERVQQHGVRTAPGVWRFTGDKEKLLGAVDQPQVGSANVESAVEEGV